MYPEANIEFHMALQNCCQPFDIYPVCHVCGKRVHFHLEYAVVVVKAEALKD